MLNILRPARTCPHSKSFAKGMPTMQPVRSSLGGLSLALPAHRYTCLLAIFDELQGLCRVSLKKWYKVLGELRSMTLAIPGGHDLSASSKAASNTATATASASASPRPFELSSMILNTSPAISAPALPACPRLYLTFLQHSALPMLPSLEWVASGSRPPHTPTCAPSCDAPPFRPMCRMC
jgi:hypothetical protein